MRAWLAAGLLCGALPAVAQVAGTADLEACLASAPDRSAEEACLYLVHDACLEAGGDDTTAGQSACLQAETAVWDRKLNALWPGILAAARAADAADEGADGGNAAALRAAQRAWIAFRDAECAWTYQRWSGGTIRTLMAGSCQLELTARRVLDFREWLRDGG